MLVEHIRTRASDDGGYIVLMSVIVSRTRCERVIAPKMVIIFIQYCPRDIMNAMCSNFCFTTHSPYSVHRKTFFLFRSASTSSLLLLSLVVHHNRPAENTVYVTFINIYRFSVVIWLFLFGARCSHVAFLYYFQKRGNVSSKCWSLANFFWRTLSYKILFRFADSPSNVRSPFGKFFRGSAQKRHQNCTSAECECRRYGHCLIKAATAKKKLKRRKGSTRMSTTMVIRRLH